ncbi:hypothetical protein MMC25_003707 [Agyrium rufum]|nr:hypothetical protein [Agyrium rufum]
MSKTLVVFGATGHQGGSVIDYVLNDSELSHKFKLRAITRDLNSPKAKLLKGKVDVVQGDSLDRASLETALSGVHTVFAMTTPSFGPDAFDAEYNMAKTIADVAIEKGAEYIIFSTLPHVSKISGGKYTKVVPFDSKAKAEQYIRGLPIKSAFYSPGGFMESIQNQPFLAPKESTDGTWIFSRHVSPKVRMPMVDASGDTGKFIGAILAEPDKYEGETFCAAVALYSFKEMCAILSKSTGKTVVYKQTSPEEFRSALPVMFGGFVDGFVEAFSYGEEFGYYGPGTEELVAWAAANARGKLSTLEEYLEAHPFRLE